MLLPVKEKKKGEVKESWGREVVENGREALIPSICLCRNCEGSAGGGQAFRS